MGRCAVVGGLLIMLAGCSLDRETSPGPPTGAVRGDVLAGPTCPVESTDAVGCEPVPVGGSVQVWQGDANVAGSTTEVHLRCDTGIR